MIQQQPMDQKPDLLKLLCSARHTFRADLVSRLLFVTEIVHWSCLNIYSFMLKLVPFRDCLCNTEVLVLLCSSAWDKSLNCSSLLVLFFFQFMQSLSEPAAIKKNLQTLSLFDFTTDSGNSLGSNSLKLNSQHILMSSYQIMPTGINILRLC